MTVMGPQTQDDHQNAYEDLEVRVANLENQLRSHAQTISSHAMKQNQQHAEMQQGADVVTTNINEFKSLRETCDK